MKIADKALSVLKTVAPTIAKAYGGPFAPLASAVVSKVIGGKDDNFEEVLLAADPEKLREFKKAEQAFQSEMRELDIKEQDLIYKDVQDAREFAEKTDMKTQTWLAALFIGGYFVVLLFVLSGFIQPAESIHDMALILLGVLAGEVPRIMSFFFGSTKGSSDKNQTIAAMLGLKNVRN